MGEDLLGAKEKTGGRSISDRDKIKMGFRSLHNLGSIDGSARGFLSVVSPLGWE